MSAIPAGYKQTEVGVIPEDWEVQQLGDIATIATGNTPPTHDVTNYGDEFLFVSPGDLGDGKQVIDTQKKLSKKGFALSRCFPKDSVLFVCIGSTIGKCGMASIDLTTNQQINTIFPSSSFSTDYLYYTVCAAAPRIRALAGEQAVPIVNKTQFSETQVPFPPLPEQRAIAAALSDVDALLAKLDQLIAKKRDLKQAAMQQLLTGQTRLPGFSGAWQRKAIGSQIDLLTGFPFPSSSYSESGVRLLRGSNVKRGETDWNEELVQYWPSVTPEFSRYQLSAGDLVIAMDGSLVGRSYARLTPMDLPAVLLQRVARIRSKVMDVGFLTQVVGSKKFVHYCDSVKTVTAIPHISSANIRNFEVDLPPSVEEQTAIATVLSDMDAELSALVGRREKIRALKQGMMQELLTGRIRLV